MVVRIKILVTGADGQLGMELRELATAWPQYEFIFTTRKELPFDDPATLRLRLSGYHAQYLVNCAAFTAVDLAETEEELAFRVNTAAPAVLALHCLEHDIKLIHLSTDYVFDGRADVPYTETDQPNPQTIYGVSKREGEKEVLKNKDAIIIRTAWVYSKYGKNFVKTMIRLMNEKPSIRVVNDQFGSPTHAADLAAVILQIISAGEWQPGIYHYSNEGLISWYDFALAIREQIGSGCKVEPVPGSEYPTPAKRPGWSVLDKHKIRETFGLAIPAWEASLHACITAIS